jgi:hypothetical protein
MGKGIIHARLAAAVKSTGAPDPEGVLEHSDDTMPLCAAIRLADRCGVTMRELFGQALLGGHNDVAGVGA